MTVMSSDMSLRSQCRWSTCGSDIDLVVELDDLKLDLVRSHLSNWSLYAVMVMMMVMNEKKK